MTRAAPVVLRRALAAACLAAVVAACRHQPKPGAPGVGAAAAGTAAAPGIAPVFVPDSSGIRRYLETVDTVRGAAVDLTWSPNTVRLDRSETLRSLRRVSRSGATFTFDAREPKVRDLKPGQVLLVWGIALRKVTAVEPKGDRIVVRTDVASLPEAIQSGTIAWKSRTALGRGLVSPAAPAPGSSQKRASLGPAEGPFRFAAYRVRLRGSPQESEGAQGGQAQGEPEAGSDEAEEAELPHHAEGELGGYEFEVGYGSAGDRLEFQLEARKGEFTPYDKPQENAGERARAHGTEAVGGGGEAPEEKPLTPEEKKKAKEREELEKNTKKGVGEIEHPASALTPKGLFGLAAESFDLRVRVRGHLDDFATEGKLAIANAALGNFQLALSDLHGEADLEWIARLGESGTFSENVKVEVPWNYDIPLIIAGIPFVIEVGVNFLAAPGLTSRYASAAGSYHIAFSGGAGITATPADVKTESSLAGKPETRSRQVTSLGVSAVLVAAQVPRIGFGLGLLNTSAVAYVDHVLATSVVTAGGMSLVPCRRYQINSAFGAGVGVQLLGIPIPGLGKKKILGQPFDEVITEPPGANCKV